MLPFLVLYSGSTRVDISLAVAVILALRYDALKSYFPLQPEPVVLRAPIRGVRSAALVRSRHRLV